MSSHLVLVVGESADEEQLCTALSRLGYVTERASDRAESLERLRGGHYTGCVIDRASLGDRSAESLRLMRAMAREMAVVLRGAGRSTQDAGLLLGADDVLASSADAPAVAKRLRMAIERRQRARQQRVAGARRVLFVDSGNQPASSEAVCQHLRNRGFHVSVVHSGWEALSHLRQQDTHVVLADLDVADLQGQELVAAACRYDPSVMPIVATSRAASREAMEVLRRGASDFLFKPLDVAQTQRVVETAWSRWAHYNQAFGAATEPLVTTRVLLISSDDHECVAARRDLMHGQSDCDIVTAATLEEAQQRLVETSFECIVTSLHLTDSRGLDTLMTLHQVAATTPTVVLVGASDRALAEQALLSGARDFMVNEHMGNGELHARVLSAVEREHAMDRLERFVLESEPQELSRREVIRGSMDGMLVVDQHRRVLFANPAAERLLGQSAAEMEGKRFPFALSTEQPSEFSLPSSPTQTGRGPMFLESRAKATEWDGLPSLLVTLRDITHRKHAEHLQNKLKQSERLVAIGQLAAGITHEINNPATYVTANLTAMGDRLVSLTQELASLAGKDEAVARRFHKDLVDLKEMVDENLEGMRRVKAITSELRTFSRIDTQATEYVDLADVVRVAKNFVHNDIRHRAELETNVEPGLYIEGNRGKLTQVLTNLLVNAGQAIIEGQAGKNKIKVRCYAEGKQAIVEVEDTGVGMTEEVARQAFEPFFTTKSAKQGTGLGLALCHEIVRQHGGAISVRSRLGLGSCFRVTLPLANSKSAAELEARQQATPLPERLRMLLIDDEERVLRAYKRMFSRYDVHTALGGREGLQLLERDQNFDVILCDLMMPDVDGPMVYEKLLENAPDLAPRVLFCSGGAFTDRARQFTARLPQGCLEKPLERDAFERAVKRVLALRGDER